MPDYGPRPKVMRINPAPRIRRTKGGARSLESLEEALMGRLIYYAGKTAGKQAAMTAYNYGLRDKEKLRYVKNFAQDEARNDTYNLLEQLRADQGSLPDVTIEAEQPDRIERETILNMGLRQLRQDNI